MLAEPLKAQKFSTPHPTFFQQAYYVLTHFLSITKLDVVIAIALVVMAVFSGLLTDLQIGLCVTGIILQLLWIFVADVMAKREQRPMAFVFFAIALLEPMFIIYKFYFIAIDYASYESLISGPIIVLGSLALIVRLIVVIYAIRVIRNFGLGLREAYIKRRGPRSINRGGDPERGSGAGLTGGERAPLVLGGPGGPVDYGGIDDDDEEEEEEADGMSSQGPSR